MRLLRSLIKLGIAAVLISAIAIGAVTALSQPCTDVSETYDIAVVLGAGMDADGRLHGSTTRRVVAGVSLINSGSVRSLHMTGGRAVPGGPAAGERMQAHAVELGIDQDLISVEDNSLSTLQNALFSVPDLPGDARLILVTEGFHLARGWLSFAWAGRPVSAICHSTRLRPEAPVGMLIREVAAFWFNAARAGAWSILHLIGQPRERIDALLA